MTDQSADQSDLRELVAHLTRTSRLTPGEAARVVADVLAFLDETPEAFVRRRHLALQAAGLANPAIYQRLAQELGERRFRAQPLSARQIRRIIYG